MARSRIPLVILGPDGRPLPDATVTIRLLGTTTNAIVYAEPTGPGQVPGGNPVKSDARGRVPGWVDRGAYEAIVAHASLGTLTEAFDAAPGSDGAIDRDWLAQAIRDELAEIGIIPPGAVGTTELANAAVTAQKIAAALKGGPANNVEALRALGTSAGQALPGNHASVTNARTPTAHAASHGPGGADPLWKTGWTTINTDGNGFGTGTVAHGLGHMPSVAFAFALQPLNQQARAVNWNTTNVSLEVSGGAGFSSYTVYWVALRA